jgi:iron(III) transport system permease protein
VTKAPTKSFSWPAALLALLLAGVVGLPLLAAFIPEDFRAAWEAYRGMLQESRQGRLLSHSVLVAAGTALTATALGAPVGYLLAYLRPRACFLWSTLVAIPLLAPRYVFAAAWIDLLGGNGLLHSWLPVDLYSIPGVIWVLSCAHFPIAALATAAAVRRFDAPSDEAARLHTSRFQVFWGIHLPLLSPFVALGACMIFLLSLLCFSIPSLLQVNVYAVEIHTRFATFHDLTGAVAHGLPLMTFALLLAGLYRTILRPKTALLRGTGTAKNHRPGTPAGRAIASAYLGALLTFCVLLPLGVVGYRALPLSSLLDAWRTAGDELLASLAVAACTALAGMALALFVAVHQRSATWLRRSQIIAAAAFLAGGPILGLGFIRLWTHAGPLSFLFDTPLILVWACLARYLIFPLYGLDHAVRNAWPRLEEAATVHGVTPLRAVWGLWLPTLSPHIVAWGGVLFVLSLAELDTILLVSPPGWTPLSVRVFSLMHYGPSQTVAALCLLTTAVPVVMAGLCFIVYHALGRWSHG